MGRAGNIFSCFKEFPPRYVPGTDFSGSPVENSFEGRFDSSDISSIYGIEYNVPIKLGLIMRRTVCLTDLQSPGGTQHALYSVS